MRTIKFRAWDKELNKMVYRGFVGFHGGVYDHDEDKDDEVLDRTDFMIPMQFTGLLDKNGLEIFESDILETTDLDDTKQETVTWINNKAGFNINQATINEFKMVVIGNTWEGRRVAAIGNTKE